MSRLCVRLGGGQFCFHGSRGDVAFILTLNFFKWPALLGFPVQYVS